MTQQELIDECVRLAGLSEKPTLDKVRPLIQAYYNVRGENGCCNHIVLEDPNQETHHVNWCIARAVEKDHADCEAVGNLLLRLSITQRESLYKWEGKYK